MNRRSFIQSTVAAPIAARLANRLGAVGSRRGRSTRSQDHIVVVGAGAFGGWTALHLLRAGHRVTLVDAWGPGNSRASSGGETRVIRAVYNGVSAYSQMAARALVLWREAEQQWKRPVYVRTGALWLCAGDDSYVRKSIQPVKEAGLTVEELSPSGVARRFPQCAVAGVRTAFLEPEAGFLTARVACELVRDTFVREGGTYKQGRVTTAPPRAAHMERIGFADGTTLEADRFVFALGPWMGRVFPDAVGRRIVATRQEVFFFGTPSGDRRFDAGSLPVWVHIGERLVYGIPNHEGRGLKIADDTAGAEVDPTTVERVPSAGGIARAREILRARFPVMRDAPLVEARVCQYEASSDGHFLIDRIPGTDNAWLVGGGSGHGFKMGPALGEHVAALVQGKTTVNPLFAYGRLRPRPTHSR